MCTSAQGENGNDRRITKNGARKVLLALYERKDKPVAKSIIQDERYCYLTRRTDHLEEHHVFGGYNRKNSEKYGLKIYLTAEMHRDMKKGIHCNHELDMKIKAEIQEKAMEHYGWDIEDFRHIFGKSYV